MGFLLLNVMPISMALMNVALELFNWFAATLAFLLSAIAGIAMGIAGV